MKSSKSGSGRRRWTAKEHQRLLARFHQSQLSQRDFATRHGVGLSTLSKWLRDENILVLPPEKFKEVVLPNAPLPYAVEVVSPQGWIVRLPTSSDIQGLPQLLQALPC